MFSMVFLVTFGILVMLAVLLATGIAALPIVLFLPVVVIIVYLVWMFIKQMFTARPS
jgi:hypothetical protein